MKGCQRTLLIALCITELSYSVLNIGLELPFNIQVGNVLFTFTLMCVLLLYVFIMFLITIDRFLEIYLNIKYRILWPPEKTMLILLFGVIISLFSLIPSYLVGTSDIQFCSFAYVPIKWSNICHSCLIHIFLHYQASLKTPKEYFTIAKAASIKQSSCSSRRSWKPI